MEERFTQERKLIVENNSTQNKRQLDFIDQLIKDKQSLGEFERPTPLKKIYNCRVRLRDLPQASPFDHGKSFLIGGFQCRFLYLFLRCV